MTENLDSSEDQQVLLSAKVEKEQMGLRFDQAAAILFPEYSRGQLQKWIQSGELTLDESATKAKKPVSYGQILAVNAKLSIQSEWLAEALQLDVLFEDDDVLVINKPSGLVVHPAAGNTSGTLANAVLAHCLDNKQLPRAGIVHRLDKDTTGAMMVAKSLTAHQSLVDQLQQRTVSRAYRAIVCGKIVAGGTINAPIGRHPQNRLKMSVRLESDTNAKPAITHFRIEQRFGGHTELRVNLETGRTHQIRVHLANKGYPLFGDQLYLGNYRRPADINERQNQVLAGFKRQALHAEKLSFVHPSSGDQIVCDAPLPDDYRSLIDCLNDIDQSRKNDPS